MGAGRKRRQEGDSVATTTKKKKSDPQESSTQNPVVTAAKPSVPITDGIKTTDTRSAGAKTNKRKAISKEPTEQPVNTAEEHTSGDTTNPTVASDKPIVGTDKPIEGTEKPVVASEKPIVASEKPDLSTTADGNTGAKKKNQKRKAISQDSSSPAEPPAATAEGTDSSSHENAKKVPKRSKNYCFEPQGKSWFTHIAGLAVHRFVSHMVSQGIDPRSRPESVCAVKEIFSDEDKKVMWRYISKQYHDVQSLDSILSELKPYAKLTEHDLIQHDTEAKYKDVIPRPPLTSYMLYYQRKLPSIKKKYPDLKTTELTQKLGQKWKSLQPEEKEKYKLQYDQLKEGYKQQLEQFYAEHPDAKVVPAKKTTSKRTSKSFSPGEVHLKELKKLAPKCVPSACALFCEERSEAMQQKHPDLKPKDIKVCLHSKWVKMSEEEKAPYNTRYQEVKAEYNRQIQQFVKEHPEAQELFKTKGKTKPAPSQESSTTTQSVQNGKEHEDNKVDADLEERDENESGGEDESNEMAQHSEQSGDEEERDSSD